MPESVARAPCACATVARVRMRRTGHESRRVIVLSVRWKRYGSLAPKVKLQARYNRCGEAASELGLALAFVG